MRLDGKPARPAATTWLAIAAGCAAVAAVWAAWNRFPTEHWNDLRLAPAFGLRYGVTPYSSPGSGPVSTWIYGPVGILVNLPATFASSPLKALHAAFVVNLVLVVGPLVWVLLTSEELRARGYMVVLLAVAVGFLFLPTRQLAFQVADHSAVAFGIASSWLLIKRSRPSNAALLGASACCALAVWSKQVAVFVALGQVAYLYAATSAAVATRYIAYVAAACLAAAGAFALAFGIYNLWFNLVEVPFRLPWADPRDRLALRSASLVTELIVPVVFLIVIQRERRWPTREAPSGRFFQLMVWIAAAMAPVGLAGLLKVGGDMNLVHSFSYLLPAFLLFLFANSGVGANVGYSTIVVLAGLLLNRHAFSASDSDATAQRFLNAEALARQYQGRIWFPQSPVIGLYGDGHLWHTEDGLQTRALAGVPLFDEELRRHLPQELEAIAYPVGVPPESHLLPQFAVRPSLPYWQLFARARSLGPARK